MKIFYDNKMVGPDQGVSPSPQKPKLLASYIRRLGLQIEFGDVVPVAWEDFYLSHTKDYVDGIRNSRIANGFGDKCPIIRDTLPYTTGALLSAARYALENKIAWAFCSGFHHAERNRGMGFCTFEGLTVTLKKLILECKIDRGFILDGDAHYGNGCVDCMTEPWLGRISYTHPGNKLIDFSTLEKTLDKLQPELILFQDGMDAYRFDPLGGSDGLTYHQLYERCKRVCRICKQRGIPLVINLAGGYKRHLTTIEPVLVGHSNDIIASIEVYEHDELNKLPDFGPFPWEEKVSEIA